jgi:hypothetical protein
MMWAQHKHTEHFLPLLSSQQQSNLGSLGGLCVFSEAGGEKHALSYPHRISELPTKHRVSFR